MIKELMRAPGRARLDDLRATADKLRMTDEEWVEMTREGGA